MAWKWRMLFVLLTAVAIAIIIVVRVNTPTPPVMTPDQLSSELVNNGWINTGGEQVVVTTAECSASHIDSTGAGSYRCSLTEKDESTVYVNVLVAKDGSWSAQSYNPYLPESTG